jgi:hypothetical protein
MLTVLRVPTLTGSQILPGGQFTSFLSGPTNRIYVIEISANLLDWSPLLTLPHSNALTPFVDSDDSNPGARYYRARVAQ